MAKATRGRKRVPKTRKPRTPREPKITNNDRDQSLRLNLFMALIHREDKRSVTEVTEQVELAFRYVRNGPFILSDATFEDDGLLKPGPVVIAPQESGSPQVPQQELTPQPKKHFETDRILM